MAVTTYYSVGGEIMAERSGSTRTDYTRDALGSVIGTKRVSGIINQPGLTNTYRYKPYGERLSKTGNAPDPRFQWRGMQATVANSLLSTPVKNYDLSSGQVFGLVRDSIVQKGTLMGGALSRKYPVCGGIGAQWQNLKPSEVWISHHGISITQCGGGEFHTWWKLPPTGARSAVGAVIQKVNIVTSPCFTNCTSGTMIAGCCGQGVLEYIEGWPVSYGSLADSHDIFGWFTLLPNRCIKGNVGLMGKVGYYDGCEVRDENPWKKGEFGNECFNPWGGLLYVKGTPAGFRLGPGSKEFEYKSDCCVESPGNRLMAKYTCSGRVFVNETVGSGWSGKCRKECCPKEC